jgi:hypothetical protein
VIKFIQTLVGVYDSNNVDGNREEVEVDEVKEIKEVIPARFCLSLNERIRCDDYHSNPFFSLISSFLFLVFF